MYHQATWDEPVIFELGSKGRLGHSLPAAEDKVRRVIGTVQQLLPENMRR